MSHIIKTYDPDQNEDLFNGEPESIWYSSSVEDIDVPEDSSLIAAEQPVPRDMSQDFEDVYSGNSSLPSPTNAGNRKDAEHDGQQDLLDGSPKNIETSQLAMMSGALSDDQEKYNPRDGSRWVYDRVNSSQLLEEQELIEYNPEDWHAAPHVSEFSELRFTKPYEEMRRYCRHRNFEDEWNCGYLEMALADRSGQTYRGSEVETVIQQIKSKDTRQLLHSIDPDLSRSQLFCIYHQTLKPKNGPAEDVADVWARIQSPPYDTEGNKETITTSSVEDDSLCEYTFSESESQGSQLYPGQHGENSVLRRAVNNSSSMEGLHSSLLQSKPYLSEVTPTEVQGHHPSIIPRSPQRTISRTSSLASGGPSRSLNICDPSLNLISLSLRDSTASALSVGKQDLSSPFGDLLNPSKRSTESIKPSNFGQSNSSRMPVAQSSCLSPRPRLPWADLPNTNQATANRQQQSANYSSSQFLHPSIDSYSGYNPVLLPMSSDRDSYGIDPDGLASSMPTSLAGIDNDNSVSGQHRLHSSGHLQREPYLSDAKRPESSPNDATTTSSDPFVMGANMISLLPSPDTPSSDPLYGLEEQISHKQLQSRKTRTVSWKDKSSSSRSKTHHRAMSGKPKANNQDGKSNSRLESTMPSKARTKSTTLGVQGDKVKVTKTRSASRKASGKTNLKPAPSGTTPEVPSLPDEMDLDLPLPELSTSNELPTTRQSRRLRSQTRTPEPQRIRPVAAPPLQEPTDSTNSTNTSTEAPKTTNTKTASQQVDLIPSTELLHSQGNTSLSVSKAPPRRRRMTPYHRRAESGKTESGGKTARNTKAVRTISRVPRTPRSRKGREAGDASGKEGAQMTTAKAANAMDRTAVLRRSPRVAKTKDSS